MTNTYYIVALEAEIKVLSIRSVLSLIFPQGFSCFTLSHQKVVASNLWHSRFRAAMLQSLPPSSHIFPLCRSLYLCFIYLQGHQSWIAAAAAKSLQSCLTLCGPINSSPPGSPVPGILQAILEWVAISFSSA